MFINLEHHTQTETGLMVRKGMEVGSAQLEAITHFHRRCKRFSSFPKRTDDQLGRLSGVKDVLKRKRN